MGHGDDVLHRGDGVVGEIGDILGHPAGLQGGDHVLVAHQLAPGQIQNADTAFHLGDGVPVDEVLGGTGVGDVDGDIVRHLVQLVHVLDHMDMAVQPQGGVHRQVGVVAVHVHPQVQADVAHQGADGTQADDTQGLTVELRAHKGGFAFLHGGGYIHIWSVSLFLDPVHAPDDVPGGDEQGGDDQLLYCVGIGTGGIEDHDAGLGAAVDGNVVGAGARPGDGTQGIREDVVVHLGAAHQDAVLVLHILPHLEAALVQLIQAGGCDLVHGFDAVHMAITSNPDF